HRVGGDGSVAAEDVREGELRAAEGGPEASVEGVVVVGQVLRRAALAGDGAVVAGSGVVVEAAVNANNVAGANLQIATRGEGDDAAAGVRRDRPWHHCRHVGTAVEAADALIEEDDVAGVGVLDRFVQLKGEAGVRGHRGRAVRRHDGHDLRRNWARCLDGKSVGDGQIAVGRVGDGDVVRSSVAPVAMTRLAVALVGLLTWTGPATPAGCPPTPTNGPKLAVVWPPWKLVKAPLMVTVWFEFWTPTFRLMP